MNTFAKTMCWLI